MGEFAFLALGDILVENEQCICTLRGGGGLLLSQL